MHVHYKFGLFMCFLVTLRCFAYAAPNNLSSSYYEDDYDDLEDYYDENETNDAKEINKIHRLSSQQPSTTTKRIPTFTEDKAIPKRSNHVLIPNCPQACLCLEDFKFVQCSSAGLENIPHDLPNTALIIDLSNNNISLITSEDFENFTKLIEINLNNNQLKELNKESFKNMRHLQRLRMSNNHLTELDPDTFAAATELRTLDLSNNQIRLPADTSFLNQPFLLEFLCRNCSWTQLYDITFTNMSALTTLKLDLNNFSKTINTNAFIPLRNLIKLKLPDLDPDSIQQLCNLLKSIDNISFKHFDVTCFELVLGTSFNDSLILATDPPYIAPAIVPAKTSKDKKETPTATANVVTPLHTNPKELSYNKIATNQTMNANKSNRTVSTYEVLTPTNSTVFSADISKGAEEDDSYQVPVSQKTINIMLISIMIIAIIGLLVGVVCRKDIGGIKTKCCRTRKEEPKNQMPTPEEIPLNKIE